MGSSRRVGVAESRWTGVAWEAGVNTYDSAGGKDYADLLTYEAVQDVDRVALTINPVLECFKGAHDDNIDYDGGTSNATYFSILRCATGESYIDALAGVPKIDGSCVYIYNAPVAGVNQVIELGTDYTQAQDIVSANLKSRDGSQIVGFKLTGDECAFVGCAGYKTVNGGTGEGWNFDFSTGGGVGYLINCISIGSKTNGIFADAGDNFVYNFTSYNEGVNSIVVDTLVGNTLESKNCIYSSGVSDIQGTHNQTTCTTDTPSYRDAANDDLRLQRGDPTARNEGTDLSADGDYPFDDDVMYKTRTGPWSMGAFEYFLKPIIVMM